MKLFVKNSSLVPEFPALARTLTVTANVVLAKTVPPFSQLSPQTGRIDLKLQPSSLIGAPWLQASLALVKQAEFRRCLSCGTPIEISTSGGARTDAMFCSDRCKSRDFRKRKAEAKDLASQGVTPAQIAKRLRTDAKTVRTWIAKGR
jgi:endogenous inhibitor of DNA gyrase (YacG/DUF329 family)